MEQAVAKALDLAGLRRSVVQPGLCFRAGAPFARAKRHEKAVELSPDFALAHNDLAEFCGGRCNTS